MGHRQHWPMNDSVHVYMDLIIDIPVNTGTFMVSSQKEEVVRIFDFVRQDQAYGFQRSFSSARETHLSKLNMYLCI